MDKQLGELGEPLMEALVHLVSVTAGEIGSPAAIMNAITDALGGVEVAMPATAEKVWRALRASGTVK